MYPQTPTSSPSHPRHVRMDLWGYLHCPPRSAGALGICTFESYIDITAGDDIITVTIVQGWVATTSQLNPFSWYR